MIRLATKTVLLVFFLGIIIFTLLQFFLVKLNMRTASTRLLHQTLHVEQLPFDLAENSLSEDKLVEETQKLMPNLPIVFWNQKPMGMNKSCARFPSMYDIEFNNLYWQTLRSSNGTFQLYGAYLDRRSDNRLGPTVRILGMIDRIDPTVKTYCHFWFWGKREPVITKSLEYKYIWYKKWGNYRQGIYQPYLTACVLPQLYKEKIPESISLVEKSCDTATNNLRVIYNKPETRKDFAVCVKGLDFLHQDLSVRLVEWIEVLNLLGADKVFFYVLQVHPNISKVLDYYQKEGKVHVTPTSLAGGQPNVPFFQHLYLTKKVTRKRLNELIPYNDCFYKHMYEYKYITLLDIDEVILPVEVNTWKELMDKVLPKVLETYKKQLASYQVRNVYFLDVLSLNHGWFEDIPKYMHMLQHVYRTKNFSPVKWFVKGFHNTDKVMTLHNHYALSLLDNNMPWYVSYDIDTADAQLHHYRPNCDRKDKIQFVKNCQEFMKSSVMDLTVWKFKEPLIDRVRNTLKVLGYFPKVGNK